MSPSELISDRAVAAGHWFLRSGIQETNGGVARYFRGDLGRNAPVSTEITGYAVSTFVWLYQRTGESEYLRRAQKAAHYLTDVAWDSTRHIFPFECGSESRERLAYAFDTGIIVRGLLALWRVTNSPHLLDMAVAGGESLARHFLTKGELRPILRLPSLEPLPYTAQWSRSPGCYQLKAALCWHELAGATGSSDFSELYSEATKIAIASSVHFLPAETPARTMDRLHAFCYFLEGLIPVAGQEPTQSLLREGIATTAAYLQQIRGEFERSDVYAQLLRIRLLAHQARAAELDFEQAESEAGEIPRFQIYSGGAAMRGGYWFGCRSSEIIPHPNPVSTAFCSQALAMWSDFRSGLPLDPRSLI